ncbi:MAG: tetratricopeptide repeat protein, partial [Persicimonas sp.]
DDPARCGELAEGAADWAYDVLGETERAANLYSTVLEVDPDNDRALERLETIARDEDQPQALEAVLRRKADRLFEPDERLETLVELGRVRLRLDLFDEAIEAFEDALELEPDDVAILEQLVGLFEITERYDRLVDVLERLADLKEDDDEVRLMYVRIGQYCSQFLDRPAQAIEGYRRAREFAPNDRDLLRELEDLYEETEQWANLIDAVDAQLELLDAAEDGEEAEEGEEDDEEERLRLLVRRAQVNYEQFGETERAIEDFQAAFAINKESPRVVEALDELYRSEGRWHDLMDLYSEQLQLVDDEDRLVEMHVEMADILHEHLDADERALEFLDAVQSLDPDHPGALDIMQSIHASNGDFEQVVSVLEQKASTLEGDDKIAVIEERADVLEERLDDPARAADALIEILEVDPAHGATFDRLERTYEELGAYEQLYELISQKTAMAETEEEMVEVFLEMADIAADKLGDPARRTEALERAYALRSDDLDIVEPLLDAYIENEDFEEAEPLLADVIQTLKSDRRMEEVVRFEHLRGKLAEQMGDLEGAREAYEAAHSIDASHIPNLLSLGKLLVRLEEWDEALKIFQTLLLHQMSIDDPQQKVDLYYNLGLVRLQQGEDGRAKSRFNRALDIDPNHEPSKEALAEL